DTRLGAALPQRYRRQGHHRVSLFLVGQSQQEVSLRGFHQARWPGNHPSDSGAERYPAREFQGRRIESIWVGLRLAQVRESTSYLLLDYGLCTNRSVCTASRL